MSQADARAVGAGYLRVLHTPPATMAGLGRDAAVQAAALVGVSTSHIRPTRAQGRDYCGRCFLCAQVQGGPVTFQKRIAVCACCGGQA